MKNKKKKVTDEIEDRSMGDSQRGLWRVETVQGEICLQGQGDTENSFDLCVE